MRKELVAEKLSRGWCLGSSDFKQELRAKLARRGSDLTRERFAGLEPEEVIAEREAGWERQLHRLARAAKVVLGSLPNAKSHPAKSQLAAAMKLSTSVSNGWLAQRLQMGEPASASQFARRWLLQAGQREVVERLLSRVKT